jgi:hypothetical protein
MSVGGTGKGREGVEKQGNMGRGEECSQTLEDNRPFRAQDRVFPKERGNTPCLGGDVGVCFFLSKSLNSYRVSRLLLFEAGGLKTPGLSPKSSLDPPGPY